MDEKKYQEFQKKWAQVIAKCWMDPSFKAKVLKNPNETLKEFGIEAPASAKFEVEENGDKIIHLVIPQKPEGELSEETLKDIAGGYPSSDSKCASL